MNPPPDPAPAPKPPPPDQSLSHYPGLPPPLSLPLTVLEPVPCSYLPDRTSVSRGFLTRDLDPAVFESFLDAGFRRSGHILYQPICPHCRACTPLRINTATFSPTPAQRRTARRNADLSIAAGPPQLTDEKLTLYNAYLFAQHHKPEPSNSADLESFLYTSPTTTLEIEYRLPSRELIGIGICDLTPNILSTVYFFWHPSHHRRSLGVFSTLCEIQLAQRLSRTWYHMGFWVSGSKTMDYKATLSPHELLHPDSTWRPAPRAPTHQE